MVKIIQKLLMTVYFSALIPLRDTGFASILKPFGPLPGSGKMTFDVTWENYLNMLLIVYQKSPFKVKEISLRSLFSRVTFRSLFKPFAIYEWKLVK